MRPLKLKKKRYILKYNWPGIIWLFVTQNFDKRTKLLQLSWSSDTRTRLSPEMQNSITSHDFNGYISDVSLFKSSFYIGLTEGTFKQRCTQRKSTFTHRKLSNSTELSKYIWQLKDSNTSFTTKWSIIARGRPYHNSGKICDLSLAKKLHIIKRSNNNLLNKRSELVSKQMPTWKQVLSQEQLRLILHNSYCITLLHFLLFLFRQFYITPPYFVIVPPFSPIALKTPLFYLL